MDPVHQAPVRLGRYEIVERLAAGGMGEVFVARSFGAGGFVKPVALKRIHPHLAGDESFIHMLHDEANVASAIRHPNIVATIDVGGEGDNHYVVLDYVSGDSLSRVLRDLKKRGEAAPPWVVAWIGAQISSALHAAHETRNLQGEPLDIVHRDVSLANIMLSDAGHPMLFDFGIAKAKQRVHQTTHGELKGKLCYMAPETFQGAVVDRTVDIFSLGVVLYELLTAKSPFQRGSDLETIGALQSADVPPPSKLRPHGDAVLDAIVLCAMARDRAARFQTAADLEQALRDWARTTRAPHDAGAVAAWQLEKFAPRIEARRALLKRVAVPGETTFVESAPWDPPGSHGDPVSQLTPLSGPTLELTPHSGRISGAMAPGATPISLRGGTQIIGGTQIMVGSSGPVSVPPALNTVAGVTHPTSPSVGSGRPPSLPARTPWLRIVAALAGVSIVIAAALVMVMRPQRAPAEPAELGATGIHAAPASTIAVHETEPAVATGAPRGEPSPSVVLAAGSADPGASLGERSPPSPSKAPAARPRSVPAPPRPPAQGTEPPAKTSSTKSKGPLVRSYDP